MDLRVIKVEIKNRGLKSKWIASEIGIHPSTLSRFLSGRTILSGESLIRLLQMLKIDPASFKQKAS